MVGENWEDQFIKRLFIGGVRGIEDSCPFFTPFLHLCVCLCMCTFMCMRFRLRMCRCRCICEFVCARVYM